MTRGVAIFLEKCADLRGKRRVTRLGNIAITYSAGVGLPPGTRQGQKRARSRAIDKRSWRCRLIALFRAPRAPQCASRPQVAIAGFGCWSWDTASNSSSGRSRTARAPQCALRLRRASHGARAADSRCHPGRRNHVPSRPNGFWLDWSIRGVRAHRSLADNKSRGVPARTRVRSRAGGTGCPAEPRLPGTDWSPDDAPRGPSKASVSGAEPDGDDPGGQVEVIVRGTRPPPAAVRLTRAETRQLPGAFADPFRAIEALPGVTPVASGLPYFIVPARRRATSATSSTVFVCRFFTMYFWAFGHPPGHGRQRRPLPRRIPSALRSLRGGHRLGRSRGAATRAARRRECASLRRGSVRRGSLCKRRGYGDCGGRYSYTAAIASLLSAVNLDYWDYQARVSYDSRRAIASRWWPWVRTTTSRKTTARAWAGPNFTAPTCATIALVEPTARCDSL